MKAAAALPVGLTASVFFSESPKVGLWNLQAVIKIDGETERVRYEGIEHHNTDLTAVGRE